MPTYLYRLTPPRPTFPADMTASESAAMERHFGYWADQMSSGTAAVFRPVADPNGTYGIAILTVPNEARAQMICRNDPVIAAKLGFSYDVHEMPNAVVRNQGTAGDA